MRLSSNLMQRVIEIELYIPSLRATMDIGRAIELRLTSGLSVHLMTNQRTVFKVLTNQRLVLRVKCPRMMAGVG